MKKGDKLIAIDPCVTITPHGKKLKPNLTVGKEYEVSLVEGNDLWVRNDLGQDHSFDLRSNDPAFYKKYFRHHDPLPAYVIPIANQEEADRVVKAAKAKGYVMDEGKTTYKYSRAHLHTHLGGETTLQRAFFIDHGNLHNNDQPISLPDFEAFCYGTKKDDSPLDDLPVLGEGVEAWVWDDDPCCSSLKKVVAKHIEGGWVDIRGTHWKNTSITKPRPHQVVVTMQEIAEWKGTTVENLTITDEKP